MQPPIHLHITYPLKTFTRQRSTINQYVYLRKRSFYSCFFPSLFPLFSRRENFSKQLVELFLIINQYSFTYSAHKPDWRCPSLKNFPADAFKLRMLKSTSAGKLNRTLSADVLTNSECRYTHYQTILLHPH